MNTRNAGLFAVLLSLLGYSHLLAQVRKPPTDAELVKRSLMITSLGVVNDPRAERLGKWSFGYLMTEMANQPKTGIKPEDFAIAWVNALEQDAKSMHALILKLWPETGGVRLLRDAPFRLVAVVNRLDLRNNFVLGEPSAMGNNAGEVRFIYCIANGEGFEKRATIILEFRVKRRTFDEVKKWAQKWFDLSAFDPDSIKFKKALQCITDAIVARDGDLDAVPNCSNLAALRVSQGVNTKAWNFLEFRIDAQNTGMLRKVTTKQTPIRRGINGEQIFDEFLECAEKNILAKRHYIPLRFKNMPFLADVADAEEGPNMYWNGTDKLKPSLLECRHLVSLNTCSGCHAGETGPNTKSDFYHVFPRARGAAATLSGFMTGIKVQDPAGQKSQEQPSMVKVRDFHELQDRVKDLRGLVERGRDYESTRGWKWRVH